MGEDTYRMYVDETELDEIAVACRDKAGEIESADGSDERVQTLRGVARRIERQESYERVDPEFEETLQTVITEIAESMLERAEQWLAMAEDAEDGSTEYDEGQADAWEKAGGGLESFAQSLLDRVESRPDVDQDVRTAEEVEKDVVFNIIELTREFGSEVAVLDYVAHEWAGFTIEQIAGKREVKGETIRWNIEQVEKWMKEQEDMDESQSTFDEVLGDEG